MNLPTRALFMLCVMSLCAPVGASAQQGAAAQDDKWGKPVDLKLLIPPVPAIVPLPHNYQLNPNTGGASQTYTHGPLDNPNAPTTRSAPGVELSIPSR
jgi:hypothetical protein